MAARAGLTARRVHASCASRSLDLRLPALQSVKLLRECLRDVGLDAAAVKLPPKPPKVQPTMQQQFPALATLVGSGGPGECPPGSAGGSHTAAAAAGAAAAGQDPSFFMYDSNDQSQASRAGIPRSRCVCPSAV